MPTDIPWWFCWQSRWRHCQGRSWRAEGLSDDRRRWPRPSQSRGHRPCKEQTAQGEVDKGEYPTGVTRILDQRCCSDFPCKEINPDKSNGRNSPETYSDKYYLYRSLSDYGRLPLVFELVPHSRPQTIIALSFVLLRRIPPVIFDNSRIIARTLRYLNHSIEIHNRASMPIHLPVYCCRPSTNINKSKQHKHTRQNDINRVFQKQKMILQLQESSRWALCAHW